MSEANPGTQESNQQATQETLQGSVSSQIVSEKRLYAGKYKSVEELEKAYGHSVNAFVEKSKLEKELSRYQVPDDYSVPEGLSFREEDIQEIKSISKNANLSQEQFERTAKEMHDRVASNADRDRKFMEGRRTSIGEEKINVLEDYVEKNYPATVREVVLNKLIRDESAMTDALKDRDQRLNSQVPGMSGARGVSQEAYDGQREVIEAARAYHANPRDTRLQQAYIKKAQEVGHERKR